MGVGLGTMHLALTKAKGEKESVGGAIDSGGG